MQPQLGSQKVFDSQAPAPTPTEFSQRRLFSRRHGRRHREFKSLRCAVAGLVLEYDVACGIAAAGIPAARRCEKA